MKIKKILIVDDLHLMRKVLRHLLKQAGFLHVIEAENGAIAWERLCEEGADLVLLDWTMPVMDGLELLNKIRQSSEYKHLPVIMVTAKSSNEDIVEAVQAGVSGYIVKPFTLETLEAKMKKFY